MDQFNPGELSPAESRRRSREIDEKLKAELNKPPSNISFKMIVDGEEFDFTLDETVSQFYNSEKIIMEGIYGLNHGDFMKFLICNSVERHWSYLASIRKRIYDMGNVEGIAADLGINLEDDERQISASATPETKDPVPDNYTAIQEHWNAGYISTKCPICRGPAVWHPEEHGFRCFAPGCGHVGNYEKRPGPREVGEDNGEGPSRDVRGGSPNGRLRTVRGMVPLPKDGSVFEQGDREGQEDKGRRLPLSDNEHEQEDVPEGDI